MKVFLVSFCDPGGGHRALEIFHKLEDVKIYCQEHETNFIEWENKYDSHRGFIGKDIYYYVKEAEVK